MKPARRRAAGLPLVAAVTGALLLQACGAGGFGGKEPTAAAPQVTSYVALGDGFTAAPYVGTTTSDDGCLRSEDNYPRQVAEGLGLTDVKDVSCTGATTAAITKRFKPAGARTSVAPQLDAVTPDTDLVTIGIGVEDGNLLDSLFNLCVTPSCGSDVPAGAVAERLPEISAAIAEAVRAVVARAPDAYVVVVGYPEVMPLANDCKSVPTMDDTQFFYASKGWDRFNTGVGSAARQAGAAYIDVRRLTAAHAPCTDEPWVNGGKGVPGKAVAYHPKKPEQAVVAEAVLAQVRTR